MSRENCFHQQKCGISVRNFSSSPKVPNSSYAIGQGNYQPYRMQTNAGIVRTEYKENNYLNAI
jgi:hypothetical protein